MSLLRMILVRLLFAAWTKTAGVTFVEAVEKRRFDEPVVSQVGWERRIQEAIVGRTIEIWLPQNLERRLKAALHRMNADVLTAGWGEDEQFDLEDDLSIVLISAAGIGIKQFEQEDGVEYCEWTGFPSEGGLLTEGE